MIINLTKKIINGSFITLLSLFYIKEQEGSDWKCGKSHDFLLEGNGILGTLIYTSNFKELKYHIYLTQGFHGMQKVFAFSK